MLKICLAFWKSEPKYAYKRCAYKKHACNPILHAITLLFCQWQFIIFIPKSHWGIEIFLQPPKNQLGLKRGYLILLFI